MNWKTFLALLGRDAHVARRNVVPLLLQTFLQPMMFVFIFGRVMVSSGYMPAAYKSLCCLESWRSAWCSRAFGRSRCL
jgi:ABC-2 type transport system permease protein